MKTKAAILWEVGKPWSVEEIELDPPKAGEVLVEIDRKSTRLNSSHVSESRMPSSA